MGVAEQRSVEPVRFPAAGAPRVNAEVPLDLNANPFSSSAVGTRIRRSLQTAFGDVIRHIGLQTPFVVVLGAAGTGKTLLAGMVARACSDMGVSVRRAESGPLLEQMMGQSSDVLLVDEADSMSATMLQACLTAPPNSIAVTIVFLCLPSSAARFSFSGSIAAVLEVGAMSLSDARAYLNERGNSIGRRSLFSAEAFDLLIDSSRGVPRLLRSIAGLAYFTAASEGASQILCDHVKGALAMRSAFAPAESPAEAPPAIANVTDGSTEAPASAPEVAAIVPQRETHAAQTAPAPRPVPGVENLRRPDEVRRIKLPLHLGLRGVALGIGLLISGIVGMSLFNPSASRPAEAHAASIEVVRPALPATPQLSGETVPVPAAPKTSLPAQARPPGQPAFRTPAGLAQGSLPAVPGQ